MPTQSGTTPEQGATDGGVDIFGDEGLGNTEDGGNNLDSGTNDNSENPDDYADVDPDDLETDDPEKMIQKLSGKLAYELREFDDTDKYSNSAKFAMSMITSALATDKISEEDKDSIEKKLTDKLQGESEDGNIDGETAETEIGTQQEPKGSLDNSQNAELNDNSPVSESLKISKKDFIRILKENHENFLEPLKKQSNGQLYNKKTNLQHSNDKWNSFNDNEDEMILFDESEIDGFGSVESMETKMPYEQDRSNEDDMVLFDSDSVTSDKVFSQNVKRPNNREFETSIGNIHVGRIDGDDDYYNKFSQQQKRNPFKYVK